MAHRSLSHSLSIATQRMATASSLNRNKMIKKKKKKDPWTTRKGYRIW